MFYNDIHFEKENPTEIEQSQTKSILLQDNEDEEFWNMIFDGAVSKEGVGVGIWIIPPKNKDVNRLYSFKLVFYCTNNVAEYESLILGLNILKDLREKQIVYMEILNW